MNKPQATSHKLRLAVIFLFLTAIAMFTMYSCAKDNEQLINDSEGLQLREGRDQVHYFEPNDTVKPIILGAKITQNPFSV